MVKAAIAKAPKEPKSAFLPRPVRRCAACRERKSAGDMLRFIHSDSSWAWQPPRGHITGRSLYICPNKKCLNSLKGKLAAGESLSAFLAELEAVLAAYVEKRRQDLQNNNLDSTAKAALSFNSTMKILATLKNELSVSDRN